MIVRSDKIKYADITEAVRISRTSFQDTRRKDGWFVPIYEFNPRRFEHGYEFFLSGSGKSKSAHDRSEYSATWIEWGIVIDYLFDIDPDAQIGMYRNRAEFIAWTAKEAERPGCEYSRKDMPWLNKGVRS